MLLFRPANSWWCPWTCSWPSKSEGIASSPPCFPDTHQVACCKMQGCLSAAVEIPRSGRPEYAAAEEDRTVALAASRVHHGCALLGSLLGFLAWGAGVLVQYSKCCVSRFMLYVCNNCLCFCARVWWLRSRFLVPLHHSPCLRALRHAVNSFCLTCSICKDMIIALGCCCSLLSYACVLMGWQQMSGELYKVALHPVHWCLTTLAAVQWGDDVGEQ